MAVAPASALSVPSPLRNSQVVRKSIEKENPTVFSTMSSEEVSSPDEVGSSSSQSQLNLSSGSPQPKLKSILNNPHEAPPRKPSRSGSESGFKAALKATFLPPPTPGRQIKVKDGKPLGKSFQRIDPLPQDFVGGEVLPYDPRGEEATAGDGIIPPECLEPPPNHELRRQPTISDSGYNSDQESSAVTESEVGDSSDLSQSLTSEQSSSWGGEAGPGAAGRGRSSVARPNRQRDASISSSASSSSSAAIKFAPLPVSGRLKRANSITIGVAARSHLLQSQGTAAPPRQQSLPQHVHSSQYWYAGGARPDDVVDVGEEIKKGAGKVWKKLRGGSTSSSAGEGTPKQKPEAVFEKPKKHYPKEGAPLPDPKTGELKVQGGQGIDTPNADSKVLNAMADAGGKGDQTPKRAPSPSAQLKDLRIDEDREAEEAAAAIEAAHHQNSQKEKHLPNGHHPHDLEDGPQHNSFHLADDQGDHGGSGAATPRSGMQRRLSTGTFLRGLSLRGIQEDRRRDLLGLDGDEAEAADDEERKNSGDHHRHGITVRGPSGKEEELGLEGYGHVRSHQQTPLYEEPQHV